MILKINVLENLLMKKMFYNICFISQSPQKRATELAVTPTKRPTSQVSAQPGNIPRLPAPNMMRGRGSPIRGVRPPLPIMR